MMKIRKAEAGKACSMHRQIKRNAYRVTGKARRKKTTRKIMTQAGR
jgi:hypothetical protein